MAGSSDSYHEPREMLSEKTIRMHQAIVSLMEELEAVDWYQQRADACTDDALAKILIHNKDEEIEHAMMALEWIRRHDATFDREMRTYLFTDGPITGVEAEAMGRVGDRYTDAGAPRPDDDADPSGGEDARDHVGLGVGSLKEVDA